MCRTNVSTVVPPRHPTRLDGHQIQHDDARRVGVLHCPNGSSSARDNISPKSRHDSICFPYSEIGGAHALIVSPHHPRFLSLATREKLAKAMRSGIVVPQGLIAHGRGEAFDYLLGEERSEEHTSELQSHSDLVCRLLLEKKKKRETNSTSV